MNSQAHSHESDCACWGCIRSFNYDRRKFSNDFYARRLRQRMEVRLSTISLNQQIEEVEREVRLRRDVYPRQVGSGKMKKAVADYHIARMEAVLTTLRWLNENEQMVKQRMSY